MSLLKRILLTFTVLGVSISLIRLGTYATFTSTINVTPTAITSGTVTLTAPSPGVGNRLTLGATSIVPGDTMQRAINLTSGTADMSSVTLTTTAPSSSLLDTDTTNGLQMAIDKCSTAWTESGVSPAFTYTCGGTTTAVLASRPLIGSTIALSNLTVTTAGSTDYLRLTLSFPSGAGNTLQGQSSSINYAFIGTQRTATNE